MRILSVLYWSTEKSLFSSFQCARSWAHAGQLRTCLSFILPPMKSNVEELRLVLLPFPPGATIESIRFGVNKVLRTFDSDSYAVDSSIGIESRFHRSTQPPLEALLIIPGALLASQLKRGGKMEITISHRKIEVGAVGEADVDIEAGYLDNAVAKDHLEALNAELRALDLAIGSVYRSHSWAYTRWCRELMAKVRGQEVWMPLISAGKVVKVLVPRLASLVRTKQKPVPGKIVDLIVPVFNGLDNLDRCLQSVFSASGTVPYELVCIDDASTDEAVSLYLTELESRGQITLLKNDSNSDFTKTVQRGILLHPDRDVVLLNSDTMVANDWLVRMQRAAYQADSIGTVTPFSNNASIFSYPQMEGECTLPGMFNLTEIDEMFARLNSEKVMDIPTAVGFCMYIKRSCLDRIGAMDEDNFPSYGGENDFCMWANKVGMRHVLATDTFVYHEGGATYQDTFGSLRNKAYRKLLEIHPEFQETVNEFAHKDPLKSCREKIDLARLRQARKPVVLLVLHDLAGGTELHVKELVRFFQDKVDFLCLRPAGEHLRVQWLNENEGLSKEFHRTLEFGDLLRFLRSLPIQRVHIHHVHGMESCISRVLDDLGLPFDFTVHDFYPVCPRGWLCDSSEAYCGQPDEMGCNSCLMQWSEKRASSIQEWRERFGWLLDDAQRVFVPSRDAHDRLSRYFRPRPYIVAPHLDSEIDSYPEPVSYIIPKGERIKIAVLGLLNVEKGADTLEECAIDAVERELPIEFHFLGDSYRPLAKRPTGALVAYGRYDDEDLAELLKQIRPHLVWFPARCPETYSYTLSASLRAGLPVVAPDLGAFPERLRGRSWSWLRPWQTEARQWNDYFVEILKNNFRTGMAPELPDIAPRRIDTTFLYEKDYLRPLMSVSPCSHRDPLDSYHRVEE